MIRLTYTIVVNFAYALSHVTIIFVTCLLAFFKFSFGLVKFFVGLLQKLMSILLEEDTISVDGIKKWRYTTEEPEGKGK